MSERIPREADNTAVRPAFRGGRPKQQIVRVSDRSGRKNASLSGNVLEQRVFMVYGRDETVTDRRAGRGAHVHVQPNVALTQCVSKVLVFEVRNEGTRQSAFLHDYGRGPEHPIGDNVLIGLLHLRNPGEVRQPLGAICIVVVEILKRQSAIRYHRHLNTEEILPRSQ